MSDEQRNTFIAGLRSLETPEEEEMAKALFEFINNCKLKNGDKIDFGEVVNYIFIRLKSQVDKKRIAQHMQKVLQSDRFMHCLDEDGNIVVEYSRLYMLQKEADEKSTAEAEAMLQYFVRKVENCATQLEIKKVKVTEFSLKKQFVANELEGLEDTEKLKAEIELEKNKGWIILAIDKVIEMRNQER